MDKAAEQGDAQAKFNLGFMYDNGYGVPQDDKEAVKGTTKAAEQGDAKEQNNLGAMYYNGNGVPQGPEKRSSGGPRQLSRGMPRQSNLGVMYDNGEGVPEDDKEAVKWYTKAAEQGDAVAPVQPWALLFDIGEGVPQRLY